MIDLARRERVLAYTLAATAGFVDAVGFLEVGGYFVSFMSGNSTRMVVELADGAFSGALTAGVILVGFFFGAMAGAVVSRVSSVRADRPAVLGLVAAMLLTALGLVVTDAPADPLPVAMIVTAAAMGAMNSVFHSRGEVTVPVTYMTGAVVKSAHRLVDALAGGQWAPYGRQVAMWAALALGGVAGGVLYVAIGVWALGLAAAVVLGALLVTVLLRRRLGLPATLS